MINALDHLECLTLFTEDLPATRAFYRDVFGLVPIFEDAESTVVKLGSVMLNFLVTSAAPELMAPAKVAGAGDGARALLTIKVDSVDAVVAELAAHGVQLLSGPVDRPWGRRTASFADPVGHVWEVAENLR